jgi:copper(I)-binding protein
VDLKAQNSPILSASVISDFYPSSTPHLNAAQSTSLASALYSVESTWTDSPAYTSAVEAIYSAAPSSVRSSIDASGYYYEQITSQAWYTKSVPGAQKTAISKQIAAIDSAAAKIVGTATSSGKGAMRTAAPVFAGAIGIVLQAVL